jgi:hypothetical protein
MEEVAFYALHVAAAAIRQLEGVVTASADRDRKNGEVIFTTKAGRAYVLQLKEMVLEVR